MRIKNEGSSQCQKNVRSMQGHTPSRRSAGDMLEPQAQAEAGMMKTGFRLQVLGFSQVAQGSSVSSAYELPSITLGDRRGRA